MPHSTPKRKGLKKILKVCMKPNDVRQAYLLGRNSFCVIPPKECNTFNSLTPRMSLVILIDVYQMILIMLVWRIWYRINW